MKLLFIHRSVGQQITDELRLQNKSEDLQIFDLNANTNQLHDYKGQITQSNLVVKDGNTNPNGLSSFFQEALTNPAIESGLTSYDTIAFKSCYSAAAIDSDELLAKHKVAYEGYIDEFIKLHPKTNFLIVSPPPRRPLFTNSKSAARASAFADWLEEYSKKYRNCTYFDLFNTLSENNVLSKKFRKIAPWNQHPNKAGAELAAKQFKIHIESN